MSWGMNYNDYWHGELEMADYFIEAAIKKQEDEATMQDIIAYRQGVYNLIAIKNIMSQGKVKYPPKPFGMGFEKREESNLSPLELQAKCDNELLAIMSKLEIVGGVEHGS